MIDAVQVQFEAMYRMEVELPIWKYISTPMWKKFVKSSDYFFDVAMKYISQAMIRLKSLPEDSDRELTVLEKLLARDPDPKTAIVMALDMMTAGIDTTDIIMPLLVLSNKDKYFPQAKKFIPERWMKNGPFSETKVHPFISMPFGFGPRMCIGRRFAELEIETLLTRIIRNFNVEYNYGEMKFETRLLYMPVSPLKFKFVDREN
ncbi:hypothetical protein C0J52_18992 [Blattella germanica]|nr:hypothetical protein C0J52_18992 [Blattella germanica]